MALEYRFGKMEQNIEACGRIIERMEKEHSGMQMEITMKGSSKTINPTAMESTLALMAQCTKVYG